jgi:hypothetical protein
MLDNEIKVLKEKIEKEEKYCKELGEKRNSFIRKKDRTNVAVFCLLGSAALGGIFSFAIGSMLVLGISVSLLMANFPLFLLNVKYNKNETIISEELLEIDEKIAGYWKELKDLEVIKRLENEKEKMKNSTYKGELNVEGKRSTLSGERSVKK